MTEEYHWNQWFLAIGVVFPLTLKMVFIRFVDKVMNAFIFCMMFAGQICEDAGDCLVQLVNMGLLFFGRKRQRRDDRFIRSRGL